MTNSPDRFTAVAGAEFQGGYPTEDATRTLTEELYFQRATQAYLWALPAVNMYAMKKGLGAVADTGYNVMSIYEKRLKPNTIITTPNSDVIYCMGFADLSETGPLVLEAPPKIQGLMDDFWHRPLTGPNIDGVQYLGDIGIPGPDKGSGGKYLVVPTGQKVEDLGVDPSDYFVYDCPTNGVFLFQRGFFQSVDDLSPGVKAVEGLAIRPLHGDATPMDFQHVSDLPANALFAHDASYFGMLNELIQSERLDAVDPYMHGALAALGIAKGKDFTPTDRQHELWTWRRRPRGRWPRTSPPTSTRNRTASGGPTGTGSHTPTPISMTSGTPCSTNSSATAKPATPTSTPRRTCSSTPTPSAPA